MSKSLASLINKRTPASEYRGGSNSIIHRKTAEEYWSTTKPCGDLNEVIADRTSRKERGRKNKMLISNLKSNS